MKLGSKKLQKNGVNIIITLTYFYAIDQSRIKLDIEIVESFRKKNTILQHNIFSKF